MRPGLTVFRGSDLERFGSHILIKIAALELADSPASATAQMRNEHAILTGPLSDCSGVPRVLAFGEDEVLAKNTGRPVRVLVLVEDPLGVELPDQMTADEVQKLARALVKTLTSVHARGVIHSDIKPDNLVLTDSGEVVLIDFGTSFLASESPKDEYGISHAYASDSLLQDDFLPPSFDTDCIALTFTLQALYAGVEWWERETALDRRPLLDRERHSFVQNLRAGERLQPTFLALLDSVISLLEFF